MATAWIVLPGKRFIDEIGYSFVVDTGDLWLRDIYVCPHSRGHRVFAMFLDALLHRFFAGFRVIWSDVERRNASCLRAHLHYGFECTDTLRVFHLAEAIMFRLKRPIQKRCLFGFKVNRRLLYTGRAYREYKEKEIA